MRKHINIIAMILMIFVSLQINAQVVNSWSDFGPYGKTPDYKAPWTYRGNGRVNCIEFHPTDANTLYIGTSGGVWKSTNDGASWSMLNTDLQITPSCQIQSLAVDQSDPNYIYAATGSNSFNTFSTGVFRTMNGGTTWERIVNGLPSRFNYPNYFTTVNSATAGNKPTGGTGGYIHKIVVCPFDPNTLYISTDLGMYYTNNARAATPQWYSLTTPLSDVRYICFQPGSTSSSFVVYISGSTGIAKSTNFSTWTMLTGTGTGQLNIPGDADISANFSTIETNIYHLDFSYSDSELYTMVSIMGKQVVGANTWPRGFKQIYKYTGGAWSKVMSKDFKNITVVNNVATEDVTATELAAFHSSFAVDRTNPSTIYLGGGTVGMFKSTGWTGSNSYRTEDCRAVHADHRYLKYSPLNGYMYSCNDGFLSKLDVTKAITYNCAAWIDLENANLNVSMISNFSQSPDNPDHVVAGLFDDGVSRYIGNQWRSLDEGDGWQTLIVTDNIIYYRYGFNQMKRMYIPPTGTTSFKSIAIPEPNEPSFNRCGPDESLVLLNPTDRSAIYASCLDLFTLTVDTSKTNTGTYTKKSNFRGLPFNVGYQVPVHCVQPAPTDPNTIYVSLAPNNLFTGDEYRTAMFKTTDGGGSWTQLTVPKDNSITDFCIIGIAVSSVDKNKVFIVYNGINSAYKVKASTDGGLSWTDYHSPGSISAPINAIVYEEGSNDGLYVATMDGVYYTNNTMSTWIPYRNNLACVPINDLAITVKGNKIKASTVGRGMWQAYLYCSPVTNLNINSSYPGVVSGNIPVNTPYETGGTITASTIVQAGSFNTFRSAQGIQFTPGFTATATSNVKAYICPCGTALPSLREESNEHVTSTEEPQPTTLETLPIKEEALIYPNPALSNFTVRLPDSTASVKQVQMYNLEGEQVDGLHYMKDENNELKCSVGNIVIPGKYILKIITAKRTYTTTVVLIAGTIQTDELIRENKTKESKRKIKKKK